MNNFCSIKTSLLKKKKKLLSILFDNFIIIILGGGQLQSQMSLHNKQANNGHYDSAMQDVYWKHGVILIKGKRLSP